MYCPVCKDVVLVMADRQGIEVGLLSSVSRRLA